MMLDVAMKCSITNICLISFCANSSSAQPTSHMAKNRQRNALQYNCMANYIKFLEYWCSFLYVFDKDFPSNDIVTGRYSINGRTDDFNGFIARVNWL